MVKIRQENKKLPSELKLTTIRVKTKKNFERKKIMKVRTSQIPEENGTPQRFETNQKKRFSYSNNFSDENNEESEKNSYNVSEDGGDEEETRYFKTMINIPEVGSFVLSEISNIEKDFRVVESNYGTGEIKMQYGIVINRNMEATMRYPRVNIDHWFDKEEVRDQRYDDILAILDRYGVKFINI